ncbi:hypothetical protein QTP88_022001 [Uroleucon formosanum]
MYNNLQQASGSQNYIRGPRKLKHCNRLHFRNLKKINRKYVLFRRKDPTREAPTILVASQLRRVPIQNFNEQLKRPLKTEMNMANLKPED